MSEVQKCPRCGYTLTPETDADGKTAMVRPNCYYKEEVGPT